MLKPVGAVCNMACNYCYYLEKSRQTLDKELLEQFTREYIEAQTQRDVLFIWHGGEPLLRPLSFYRHALELQRRHAGWHHIDNCLQTNGTLLTDEWCEFLRENHFLVGISIDGPQELHDGYRRYRNGTPTFDDVMKGIRLLQKHGVEWNAMATVNSLNADHPIEFYRFFKEMGCQFLQFTPVVEPPTSHHSHLNSVNPAQWGRFLCQLYDEWLREDVGRLFVQLFDATLANWVGAEPGLCSLSPTCGSATVMEADGTVYACDHFVFPEYRLGNIHQQSLTQILYSEQLRTFGQQKLTALPRQCRECQFLFACHGECPRNRFVRDRYGEPGLNYLCEGYHQFFSHVAPTMNLMAQALREGRPASDFLPHSF